MSEFSIGQAVGSGFSLIAKRPLSVLAWAVVYLLLLELPRLAHFAMIMPAWSGFMHAFFEQASTGGQPDMSQLTSFQAQMMQSSAIGWLANFAALLGWAVLAAAVYRSVLEPEKKSFASLRLGAQEGWLFLVAFVSAVVLVIAGVVIGVVCGILVALAVLAGHAMPHPASGWVMALLVILIIFGSIGAFLWICVRLSLAGPLTYVERQFRLFESWGLTKGHAWQLFGLAVVLLLIMMAIGIVVGAIEWAVVLSTIGLHGFDPTTFRDAILNLFAKPDWWRPYLPWIVGALVVRAIVGAGFTAILVAPWAVAYRELSKGAKPQHPTVF